MRHIGFKNFRRFTDFPNMEFGDITILVGSNNSGKSTIQKALMLAFDNVRSLKIPNIVKSDNMFTALDNNNIFRFDCNNIHDVHVDTFGRALNHHANKKEISYTLGLSYFSITLNLSGNDLTSAEALINEAIIVDNKNQISYDINYGQSSIKIIFNGDYDNLSNKPNSIDDRIKDLRDKIAITKSLVEIGKLNADLDNLLKLKKDGTPIVDAYLNTQGKEITIPLDRFIETANENEFVNRILGIYHYAETPATGDKRSKTYKDIVADKSLLKQEENSFKDSAKRLNDAIYSTPLEYIQAHAAFQKAVFSTEDKNDYTARTIYEFINSKINPGSDEYNFVSKWMKIFEVGKDFIISSLQGAAFSVRIFDSEQEKEDYINGDEQKGVELADKGMGSNQLMLLLWKMASFIRKYKNESIKPTIIIEEPEQNLHPYIQTTLASLFLSLFRTYGFRFIIETHSEYMVRYIQVLAAKSYKEKKTNPFKVFYLTGESDSPFYEMGFQKNGKFIKAFGKGFFNVADDAVEELYEMEDD